MNNKPLILVTNDDGIEAKGLRALIESVKPYGRVVVVAPKEPQSGMSHAITVKTPLQVKKIDENDDLIQYECKGTPVDCVKIASNQLLDRKPDLLVSGINHGSNSSSSIFYSGTMGAALEGCINNIPSIGFSLLSLDPNADFSTSRHFAEKILGKVLANGLPKSICLNVNIPHIPLNKIAGIRITRQTKGFWKEEFDQHTDSLGRNYFWLTGYFHNDEPDAPDTDEWALKNNFVSVVPLHIDLTCYDTLKKIQYWNF
ncbi:MAG: 5'/3'-nucleotidase SurE [Bacteroidales bacterium]|nr:5'/3'-nucleotidase SurE [Bacteroidales bacterium]